MGRYGSLCVLLFLKFVANFIEVTHFIMLPINIAVCNKHVVPLQEGDSIMVCGIYICMGALALIIKVFIHNRGISTGERT